VAGGDRLAEDHGVHVDLAQDELGQAGGEGGLDGEHLGGESGVVGQEQGGLGKAVPIFDAQAEEEAGVDAQEQRVVALQPAAQGALPAARQAVGVGGVEALAEQLEGFLFVGPVGEGGRGVDVGEQLFEVVVVEQVGGVLSGGQALFAPAADDLGAQAFGEERRVVERAAEQGGEEALAAVH